MHHATAEDLQPSGAFAYGATLAAAQEAFDIHFSRRFCEWEVRRAEACVYILTEHAPRKIGKRALQITEGDAVPHGEAFKLRELGVFARADLLVAVYDAR